MTLALLDEEEAAEQHALEVLLDEDAAQEVSGRGDGVWWVVDRVWAGTYRVTDNF